MGDVMRDCAKATYAVELHAIAATMATIRAVTLFNVHLHREMSVHSSKKRRLTRKVPPRPHTERTK